MPVRQHGRHRTGTTKMVPGPVTAAFKIAGRNYPRPVSLVARSWPAIPALFLVPAAIAGRLTEYADGVLGYDATLCLIACLGVTPFITLAKVRIAKLRWWYGIWVFVLGAAGLAIHMAYPPGSMGQRMAGTAVDWTGLMIVALLFPMAATSSAAAQKMLGPEWKRWQRNLIWFVWAMVGIHLALMGAWLITGGYLAATVPLILLRRPKIRKSIKSWRAGGYSTGGWWAVSGALGTVAVAGTVVIASEEVLAAVRAIALAAGS